MARTWKQIGSIFLSVCMVLTMLSTVVSAETRGVPLGTELAAKGTITGFVGLADAVTTQTADLGTAEDELSLPATLSATLSTDDGEGGTIQTETTLTVSAWVCDAPYDGDTEGDYTFAPTLSLPDGITLDEGISPPEITITVQEEVEEEEEEEHQFFAPFGGELDTIPTVTPTTYMQVEAALASKTPSNIIINQDFTLNNAVTVGENHTLSIASGKTVYITNGCVLTIPAEITLTVEGGGTFSCTYAGNSPDGTIMVNGSLILNSITFELYTSDNRINGTLTATDCDIVIEPKKEATVCLWVYPNAVVNINGGTLQVKTPQASSTGISSFANSPMQISDCEVTLSDNATDTTLLGGGSWYFEDSTVNIMLNGFLYGVQPRGITFSELTFDNTEVTLNSGLNSIALTGVSSDSALNIINESQISVVGTAGTGIHFFASQTSTPNTIFIDDSVLKLEGNGAFGLDLNAETVVSGANGGYIVFEEGSGVDSIPNTIKDRGVLFTSFDYTTVTTASAAADPAKISAGTYTWNGNYFSNIPPTEVTCTAQRIGGTSQQTNSTAIALTFSGAVSGLTAEDITITADTGAAIKGALSGADNTWTITLADVATEGNVIVSIRAFNDYSVTNSPLSVLVYSSNLPIDPDVTPMNMLAEALGSMPWLVLNNTEANVLQELAYGIESIISGDVIYEGITIENIIISDFQPATLGIDGSFSFKAVLNKNGKTVTTTDIAATISNMSITPIVVEVILSPSNVQVKKGTTQRFAATVMGINNPAQTATWELVGYSGNSTINSNYGTLTVDAAETASTLTVKATSTVNTSKFATATVSVADEITAPIYGISISNYDHGQLDEGYSEPASTSVSIRNIGNQPTGEMLAGLSNAYWELVSPSTISSVNPGSAWPHHIRPAEGLPAGTYTTALTVTGANGISTSANLTFTVVVSTYKTITFNPNGGSVITPTAHTNSSGTLSSLPTPTSSGNYRFDGWYTAASGGTEVTKATVFNANQTIYAHWTYTGGNGGGSGGGSSPSKPPVTVTIPEKTASQPITAVAPVTATESSNGTARASIPEKSIAEAISAAQAEAKAQGNSANGISVGLDVTMPKDTTSLTAELTRKSLNSLVSAGVSQLEINGAPVSLGLDLNALREIQNQSNGNISVSFTPATGLSEAARVLLGNRPVYNITISYIDKDGKSQHVSSLGNGKATLSIPYAPGRNEAVGYLFGVYVDAKGNATRIPGSAYDSNSDSILLGTNHFSVYGVGYEAPSAKFTDIANHWGKDSIDYVVGRGLLSGTSKTTFDPNTAMTRGMLVAALGRLENIDTKAYTTGSFVDVKAESAFRPYIEWAYKKGIIQGNGGRGFEPDRAITREEIAVVLSNYAKATDYTVPVIRTAAAYADASEIGSAYKTAVTAMQQAGIMLGDTDNSFRPKSSATRAEASSMLHRYIEVTLDSATPQS